MTHRKNQTFHLGSVFLGCLSLALASCAPRLFKDNSRATDVRSGSTNSPSTKTIVSTKEERAKYLKEADVWMKSDIASKDAAVGPEGYRGFKFGETINCRYVEPEKEDVGGRTPKFYCDKPDGERIKVKYGVDNGEVYSEVASSRLLWTLGFGADAMYSVRVVCDNCPADPHFYGNHFGTKPSRTEVDRYTAASARSVRTFVPAAVEDKFKAIKIETLEDQGWGWNELMNFEGVSRERVAHREALALLMSILQHPDNKPENQRLVCPKDGISMTDDGRKICSKPFALVQDFGWNFSGGWMANDPMTIRKMDLASWSTTRVWADERSCLTNLNGLPPIFTGSFERPRIHEAGRAFLASLLNQLTERQMRDIFVAARVELYAYIRLPDAAETVVDKWVAALKQKISEVNAVRCPE